MRAVLIPHPTPRSPLLAKLDIEGAPRAGDNQCESRACVGDVVFRCGLEPGHEEDHERFLMGPPGYGGRTISWGPFYEILEGE